MKRSILLTLLAFSATRLTSVRAFKEMPEYEALSFLNEESHIDTPIRSYKGDGRDPEVVSYFEQARQAKLEKADRESEHPVLQAPVTDADTTMYMLMDWNHVIDVRMRKSDKDVALIVDTDQNDFILMHPNCTACHSMHGTHWQPDGNVVPTTTELVHKDFNFFYMTHVLQAQVNGQYWSTAACIKSDKSACVHELPVYAIYNANPYFYALGDGYLGLSPHMISALYDDGMIAKKMIGVHTHLYNSTEDPSTMRFGGWNEDLMPKGHLMQWHESVGKGTWEVQFSNIKFHGDQLYEHARATINPGFPFIGIPADAWDTFKSNVIGAYPEEPVTCEDMDWCYFFKPCEKIEDTMPDMVFNLDMGNGKTQEYRVPPKSFMYTDVDRKTNLEVCHLGIVGQKFSDKKTWILGQSFMENFYVAYDATDAWHPKVGISYPKNEVAPSSKPEGEDGGSSAAGVVIIVLLTLVVVGVAGGMLARHFYRKHQAAKLEKTKNYFESLRTEEANENAEQTIEDTTTL